MTMQRIVGVGQISDEQGDHELATTGRDAIGAQVHRPPALADSYRRRGGGDPAASYAYHAGDLPLLKPRRRNTACSAHQTVKPPTRADDDLERSGLAVAVLCREAR